MNEEVNDLEQLMEDSIQDLLGDDDDSTEETTTEVEAAPAEEVTEETVTTEDASTEKAEPVATEVSTITDQEAESVEDEFSKRFGIQSKSVTGRENRIPYSRVKKIIEKNERDLSTKLSKQYEDQYKPKLTDFETKVKDFEDRFQKVGEFEKVMANDPKTFLGILSQFPAYKPFFDYLEQLSGKEEETTKATPTKPVIDPADPRPEPNKPLADGTKVYDMDGLQALLDWQSRNVEKRVLSTVEKTVSQRLAPTEQERQQKEYLAKVLPIIDNQIAEARKWPMFNESEPEITKALEADKNLSLEGAYRQVVLPKLIADKNNAATTARQKVLEEMRKKPVTTSGPTGRTSSVRGTEGVKMTLDEMILADLQKKGMI